MRSVARRHEPRLPFWVTLRHPLPPGQSTELELQFHHLWQEGNTVPAPPCFQGYGRWYCRKPGFNPEGPWKCDSWELKVPSAQRAVLKCLLIEDLASRAYVTNPQWQLGSLLCLCPSTEPIPNPPPRVGLSDLGCALWAGDIIWAQWESKLSCTSPCGNKNSSFKCRTGLYKNRFSSPRFLRITAY